MHLTRICIFVDSRQGGKKEMNKKTKTEKQQQKDAPTKTTKRRDEHLSNEYLNLLLKKALIGSCCL